MEKMKVSVCITTFNESKETVKLLLDALNSQTLKPDEIIIIDAKDYNNCSRAKGRNIAIRKAKNEIIAITDVGCIPDKDWLEKIIKPFVKIASSQAPRNDTAEISRNDTVVAGGYKMIAKNSFEKAESIFLGIKQENIDSDFMPSARSMAFTKTIWEKAGGFPENLKDTAEDTVFNINLIKSGAKFVVAMEAIVDWLMPNSIKDFALKIYKYAKGDAVSGIWWHPKKKFSTHNIKIITIFIRYGLLIFMYFLNPKISLLLALSYMLYAFKKAGLWGILLQFVSDFAAMLGFLSGTKIASLRSQ